MERAEGGAAPADDAFDEEFDFITAFGLTQEDVSGIPCLYDAKFEEISYKDLSFNIVPEILQAYPDLSTSFNKVKRAIIANNQYVAKMCYSVDISVQMRGGMLSETGTDTETGSIMSLDDDKEHTKGELETFLISNYAIFTPGGATKYILNERKINKEIDTIHPICTRLCSMCMLDITDSNIITDICNFVEELMKTPVLDESQSSDRPPDTLQMDTYSSEDDREAAEAAAKAAEAAAKAAAEKRGRSASNSPHRGRRDGNLDKSKRAYFEGGRKTRRKKSKKHRKTKRR